MKNYLLILAVLVMVGCGNRQTHPQEQCNTVDSTTIKRIVPHGEYNSIYHWKTTFNPINSELAFLRKHNVKRLYLRFFDVALDNHWLEGELYPVPIATTVFRQVPPADMEIVPTVYITLEVLRQTNVKTADLANRIVTRILAMATRHKIGNINEVQFDYDWTATTQNSYFELCRIAKDSLHGKGIELSSTIRLHQLRGDCPPVDRGVLMLYNTGALRNAETKNSILDYSDVAPYVTNANYRLHLDFAYPAFAWGIWFRDNRFKAILRTTDYSDQTYYRRQSDGTYKVLKNHYLESHELQKGDIIRLESSRYDEVLKVKRLAEKQLKDDSYSVLLYHLDSTCISNYTTDEIETLYDLL